MRPGRWPQPRRSETEHSALNVLRQGRGMSAVFDVGDGMPHYMHGMVKPLTIPAP